ncbi:MAG: PilZ domain-containing protein [Myxococcales bacterium]|nr:PilZ domain-containing protein [Myxococcales bacterium]
MAGYERFGLIIDPDPSALGGVAVRLLELGIDVLYAADMDEAALLAGQEAERLGAVLIPSSFDTRGVEDLIARVCSKLVAGPRALIVAGVERESGLVEQLKARGVEWALCEPYDERELRFVMTAAMATAHGGERRKGVRIPTCIETSVFMGRHRKDVTVHDLSVSGAYFATPHPFFEDSRISFEIPLPQGPVMGSATVVNSKSAEKPGRPDVPEGMGVVFNNLSQAATQRLNAFIEAWIERFRL